MGLFMIYLYTESHVPNSIDLSIIAMKLKDSYRYRAVAMLLCILQKS